MSTRFLNVLQRISNSGTSSSLKPTAMQPKQSVYVKWCGQLSKSTSTRTSTCKVEPSRSQVSVSLDPRSKSGLCWRIHWIKERSLSRLFHKESLRFSDMSSCACNKNSFKASNAWRRESVLLVCTRSRKENRLSSFSRAKFVLFRILA